MGRPDGVTRHPVLDRLGLRLVEPRRGHRFRPESPLVGDLLDPTPAPRSVLDLGAGCGVLGLVAGVVYGATAPHVVLVERDPVLAACARTNTAGVAFPVEVVAADIRELTRERFDLVLANPPYFAPGEGRASSNPSAHVATHALHGDVADFCAAAARHLAEGGRFWLVYPSDRVCHAIEAIAAAGLCLRRIVVVHARHIGAPYRAWMCAAREAGTLHVASLTVWTRR